MYTQECILHNPHMQDVLMIISLGYHEYNHTIGSRFEMKKNLYIKNGYFLLTDDNNYPNAIDCSHSRKQFQALASINNNSITDQWLTDGKNWLRIKYSDYNTITTLSKVGMLEKFLNEHYHKATAKEIIEHFKK